MKNIKKFIPLIIIIILFVSFANFTQAQTQEIIPSQSGAPCPQGVTNCGNYQLNDFMQVAVNVSKFILGITGSLALLAFIAGGFMFLISAGNTDKITQAKKIITGAITGIVIVFASYIIIGFVITTMGANTTVTGWATSGWFTGQ